MCVYFSLMWMVVSLHAYNLRCLVYLRYCGSSHFYQVAFTSVKLKWDVLGGVDRRHKKSMLKHSVHLHGYPISCTDGRCLIGCQAGVTVRLRHVWWMNLSFCSFYSICLSLPPISSFFYRMLAWTPLCNVLLKLCKYKNYRLYVWQWE